MGQPGRGDFIGWLRQELDRERARRGVERDGRGAVWISELEATALLFIALGVAGGGDRHPPTAALAEQVAEELCSRLIAIRFPGCDTDDGGFDGRPNGAAGP